MRQLCQSPIVLLLWEKSGYDSEDPCRVHHLFISFITKTINKSAISTNWKMEQDFKKHLDYFVLSEMFSKSSSLGWKIVSIEKNLLIAIFMLFSDRPCIHENEKKGDNVCYSGQWNDALSSFSALIFLTLS